MVEPGPLLEPVAPEPDPPLEPEPEPPLEPPEPELPLGAEELDPTGTEEEEAVLVADAVPVSEAGPTPVPVLVAPVPVWLLVPVALAVGPAVSVLLAPSTGGREIGSPAALHSETTMLETARYILARISRDVLKQISIQDCAGISQASFTQGVILSARPGTLQ